MNTLKDIHAPLSARRAAIPAWLMSAIFHAVMLILLGIFIGSDPREGLIEERERPVAIVLAHSDSNADIQYFDPSDPSSDSKERSPSDSDVRRASKQLSDALPAAADAPVLPDLHLPDSNNALPIAGDTLLSETSLTGTGLTGKGRAKFLADNEGEQAFIDAERAARQAAQPSGAPARVSVFGSATAVGRSFVFVIDRSKSMGSNGLGVLEAAQTELDKALRGLSPSHEFQIIAYNQQTQHMGKRRLKLATDENRELASKFVGRIAAYGATEHQTALMSALNLQPDVIFLLTDGGYPELTEGELRLIRRTARRQTTIHCIRFGFRVDQEADHFMNRLARQNGGTFKYVDMSKRP